jgi:hypothetical protein
MVKEYIVIRKTFTPYSHKQVSEILESLRKEFGPTYGESPRWFFKVPAFDRLQDKRAAGYNKAVADENNDNDWQLDFYIRDRNDALIFCLKYLGEAHANI